MTPADEPKVTAVPASVAEAYKPLPPEPPKEPEPKAEGLDRKVAVVYDGHLRVEHTLTGEVFEHGDKAEMTFGEALDLQTRSGEPFTVRELEPKKQTKARG